MRHEVTMRNLFSKLKFKVLGYGLWVKGNFFGIRSDWSFGWLDCKSTTAHCPLLTDFRLPIDFSTSPSTALGVTVRNDKEPHWRQFVKFVSTAHCQLLPDFRLTKDFSLCFEMTP